jgi:hypothetical protein
VRTWLGVTVLVAAAACAPKADDDTTTVVARDGTDLVSHEGDTEALAAALVGSAGGQLSLATALESGVTPSDLGDGAKILFFPKGCVTPTHDAAARKVTYVFSGCTGPFGLRRLTGTVVIGYARPATGQGISLTLTARDLEVGRATLSLTARATVSIEGTTRTSTWEAELEGKSARDRAFSRSVQRTITSTAGEACITTTGRSTGKVEGEALTVTLDKLTRCRGACPEAGGRITVEGASGTVDIAFDGTSEAKVTRDGVTKSVTLACAR